MTVCSSPILACAVELVCVPITSPCPSAVQETSQFVVAVIVYGDVPSPGDIRVYRYPQVGDGPAVPFTYGVPGLAQVVDPPSPIVQTTFRTVAVAVTVTPPNVAVRVYGPHANGSPVFFTHNHTGRPTAPLWPSDGVLPISTPLSRKVETNAAAACAGVNRVIPGGGVSRHVVVANPHTIGRVFPYPISRPGGHGVHLYQAPLLASLPDGAAS